MQKSFYKNFSGSSANQRSGGDRHIRKCFIMAAGKGVRFRPYSKKMPKCLFSINTEPIILRNIKFMQEAFDLDVIYIVVGHKSEIIRDAVSHASGICTKIEFIEISGEDVSRGLLSGYAAIAPYLDKDEFFVSVLADEYYEGIDHKRFAEFVSNHQNLQLCCGIKKYKFPDEYFNNYSVIFSQADSMIGHVKEKPTSILSEYFGLGIIAANRKFIELAQESLHKNEGIRLIDLMNVFIAKYPNSVYGCEFLGRYVNINTRSDIYKALKLFREQYWDKFSLDVIIPAWNESESISFVVKDFLAICRNVIVMDNNSVDGTAEIARKSGAVVYSQRLYGYGDALKKGLDYSDADILVLVEADGTFRAEDVEKLKMYLKNSDAIIGTRTYWQYVEYGANMPFLQRMGNIIFGSIITLLWWNRRSRFTDVGCTFRCLWRESYSKIADRLVGKGPEFSPEMIIELLNAWQRVIEIPVPYHARVMGHSKFSGSLIRSAKTALKMLNIILKKRWEEWIRSLGSVLSDIRSSTK